MPDNRQRRTYKHWTVVEAAIIEDVRKTMALGEVSKQIQINPQMDTAELITLRYTFPALACVTPAISIDDFRAMHPDDVNALYSVAIELNPEWDELSAAMDEANAEIEKKSKQPSGMSDSAQTPKAAKKRRHSQPKSS